MAYIDAFVIPVPRSKLPAYLRQARVAAKVWMDHGAIDYSESVGDDVPPGKRTSFPRSVKLKRGEVVVLTVIHYKSRAHRDKVDALVMKDKRVAAMMQKPSHPFDLKRMFFGGFKTVLQR